MKFVLLFLVLSASGPESYMNIFDSKAACEKKLAEVPAIVANYNAENPQDQTQFYAAACTPLKQVEDAGEKF